MENATIPSKKQEIFNCAICNSTFTQNSALTRHIEFAHLKICKILLTKVDLHLNKKIIKNLGNNFGTKKDLQKHESPHHQTVETGNGDKNLKNKQLKNKVTPRISKSESNVCTGNN